MPPERPRRIFVAVEGDGEVDAVPNLVPRIAKRLGASLLCRRVLRWPSINTVNGVKAAAEHARRSPDCDGLLILRDEDDGCPKIAGPEAARWLRDLTLPFPSASVLLHPEYEVLFLPCVGDMAGRRLGVGTVDRPGLRNDARWSGSWESKRGLKEWLSGQFSEKRRYKPTLDQLSLTKLIDLDVLASADVPCYGTLERAINHLANAGPGDVYPEPPA